MTFFRLSSVRLMGIQVKRRFVVEYGRGKDGCRFFIREVKGVHRGWQIGLVQCANLL